MPASEFGGIYYPSGEQDAVVAQDLMQIVDDLDSRLNLLAQDAADRDARYSDVPAGTIVTSVTGTQWVKVSSPPDAPAWKQVFDDTGVVTTGIVSANTSQPWEISSQWGRIRSGWCSVNVVLSWNGSDITAPSNGNIGDIPVANFLGKWVPPTTFCDDFRSAGAAGEFDTQSGVLTIRNMYPNSVIANGHAVRFSIAYPAKD